MATRDIIEVQSQKNNPNGEACSIIVVLRDRFSTTAKCVEHIIQNTPEPYDLVVVLGGTPRRIENDLRKRYGSKGRFVFQPHFINPTQARNIGLRAAKTRLAVLIDNDVYVRPGWFGPLLECQRETGATMVVPLILERENIIHTAGNDFYVTYENGRAYGYKELRYYGRVYSESANLKRRPTDYGELHCQLIEVEPALRLGVYDENIQEVGECDSGLTWGKAGLAMWFEPKSVVFYEPPIEIVHVEDIRFFAWRWDMRTILKGYQYFEQKWGIDITEYNSFQEWLLRWNKKLGFLPRMFPYGWALWLDRTSKRFFGWLQRIVQLPLSAWNRFIAWKLGFYEWPRHEVKCQ